MQGVLRRYSAPIRPSRKGLKDWRTWPIGVNFGNLLRVISIRILRDVESGKFLDEAIDSVFSRYSLNETQRALIYQIVSGVTRWRGYLDYIISRYTKKSVTKDVRYILLIALYQVGFMKKAQYHVLNESVEYAKHEHGQFVAGFVNALVRRFINDAEIQGIQDSEKIRRCFPQWLVKRWSIRFGAADADRLLAEFMKEPEFDLRVGADLSLENVIQDLADKGVRSGRASYAPRSLKVDRLLPVMSLPGFREGNIFIQGEASQLAGLAVKAAMPRRILDACAGAGTKTRHIMELCPNSRIVSMDTDFGRLKLSGFQNSIVCANSQEPPLKTESFDTILVDAPCSSLGILRKHPEIKWRRTKEEILRFAGLQLAIINSVGNLLSHGGRIIYSVCSFEPEETLDIVHNLVKDGKFMFENPLPFLFNKDYFISLPHETAMDGFFIARLRKL